MWAQSGELVGTVPRKRTLIHMHAGEVSVCVGGGGESGCYVRVTNLSSQLLTAQLLSSPSSGHSIREAP